MAPKRPVSRDQRDSATPSPTKGSPRKSTDKRRSTGDPAAKRASRDATPGSPTKDRDAAQRRRRSSSSPTKPAPGSPRKSGGGAGARKSSSPTKSRPKVAAVTSHDYDPPTSSGSLSADSLAKLDAQNAKDADKKRKQAAKDKVVSGRVGKDKVKSGKSNKKRDSAALGGGGLTEKNLAARDGGGATQRKNRVRAAAESVLSGEIIRRPRGGGKGHMDRPKDTSRRKKFWCFGILGVILLLAIIIPVGVVVGGRNNNGGGGGSSGDSGPNNSNLGGIDPNSIPPSAKGGYLDPFTWYDTEDFNLTYTDAQVGGLPLMGLNSTWDDTTRANQNVPPLNKPFGYGTLPIRGVNLGGWLAIEPFITPSLFEHYGSKENVVDEWTLCQKLGPTTAAQTLEKHYSSFINRDSFAEIRDAGFDHVRIPYSYWAVTTYSGDPYVPKIAWRYLLRGIEYARQNGIRVKLDFHGLPGSQNGWNHSGRQGAVGWLNGTDGTLNGQRSLDLHKQLATFFAQPRYANVVGIYGLVNEPKMISLPTDVVMAWTTNALKVVRDAGLKQSIAIGDGFLGLPKWQGQLTNEQDVVLDVHQYVIFNTDQIAFDHQAKLNFACSGWTGQMKLSTDPSTGFGPTMCGEWSQADTDCTEYINNVNVGSRWTGTMELGDPSLDVLTPSCPLKNNQCNCDGANADPSSYSATYKKWLRMNAEAQMMSFEIGYGWFYWTWLTESATQWSWKLGMQAGILPDKVWDRDFKCDIDIPNFGSMGLPEYY